MSEDNQFPGSRACDPTPRISVVVPCYRIASRRQLVEQCAESVARQTYGDYELIFVDDGSSDGSAEVLQEILDARPGLSDRAFVLAMPENGGVCAARNAGIDAARGDYVAFLDFDDLWQEGYLAAVARAIGEDATRRVILVRTDFLSILGSTFRVRDVGSLSFLNTLDPTDFDAWHLLHNFPVGMGSAITVYRALLRGNTSIRFDMALTRTTAEDVLFGFQLLDRGFRPWYVDEPLCIHRKIAGQVSRGTAAYLAVDEKSVNDYIAAQAADSLQRRILSTKPAYTTEIARQRERLDLQFELKRKYCKARHAFGVSLCLRHPRGITTWIRLHLEKALMVAGLAGAWQRLQFSWAANDAAGRLRVSRLLESVSAGVGSARASTSDAGGRISQAAG